VPEYEDTMTETTDHVWSQENVAVYVAGGLDAQEAARLEAHARECLACADAVGRARSLDRGLSVLFADVRPGPGLEDRVVFRLRTTHRRPLLAGWVKRTMAAAAAIVILGTVGALVGPAATGGGLPLPGTTARVPSQPLCVDGDDSAGSVDELTNEDVGLTDADGLRKLLDAGLPEIDRLDNKTAAATAQGKFLGVTNGHRANDLYARFGSSTTWEDRTYIINGNDFSPHWGFGLTGRSPASRDTLLKQGGGNEVSAWSPDGRLVTGLGVTDGTSATLGYLNTPAPAVSRFDPPSLRFVAPQTPVTSAGATSQTPAGGQKDPPKVEVPDNTKPQPKDSSPLIADPTRRVILRSGEIEFEVDSFEVASAGVQKLVDGVKGAFVATINSEKLANGKVKGSVTVRVPPEHLDGLVAALRKELDKNGGLKGVRIGSQDVTKQYYDLDSRLRAARTMEQRLLQIIKEGKGDIKVLLEAEKELGVWRTKIEEFEGELRYYANLAALSTLTVTITEKEIRSASALTERERVQAGVEVEDVEKAYQQVLAAVADAKGRVIKSEMKQLTAGQFNATINFEVAPQAAGPVRDRLNQLGRVARLEIDRVTQAEGGTTPTDAKTTRGDSVFLLQLYNLANIEPRETATMQVAVVDVPAAYQSLRDAVAKTTSGRVLVSQLNEQDRQNVTAQFDFEVRRADDAVVRGALDAAGEAVGRQVTRAAESEKVTDAKVMYRVALMPANRLKPREVTTLGIEVADVDAAAASFAVQVKEVGGRQSDSKTTREPNGRVVSKVVYDVPLSAAATLAERFKSAGTVRVSQSVRDPQASEGRYATARLEVTLSNAEGIVAADAGVWQQVRRGLSYSASVLLTSVTWVVFGLCVVLPWALIGYAAYRVIRRSTRASRTDTPPAAGPTAA